MSVHPIRSSRAVAEAYTGYLETAFEFADAGLREQFRRKLREPGKLVKGPFVQSTAPFMKGATLGQLVEEGVLSSLFTKYPERMMSRHLYTHQEQAIRKIVTGGRNVVVATGTGSGKTECFMIPICNYLMREHEMGTLGPGVRALLLYPMNALANDQVKRLRDLFEPFEFMTFGRYTGETLKTRDEALETYRSTFNRDPLPNELISREEMWAHAPNVLITNYAMLEYLLLRPSDMSFFDGDSARGWRFLVLDEAHTYAGVKGIETAMLIRRLKDRISSGSQARLQCAATSATLGRGLDDAPEIMRFASQLFSEEFEYLNDDDTRQDLVVAERDPLSMGGVWGRPDIRLYSAWADILRRTDGRAETPIAQMVDAGIQFGVSAGLAARAMQESGSSVDAYLFAVLSGDEHVVRAQHLLADNPLSIPDLAQQVFRSDAPSADVERSMVDLISLAVRAKAAEDDRPLLPARYHLMLRSLSGVWVSFVPEPTIHLDKVTQVVYDGGTAMAYEAAVCQKCGATYIAGHQDLNESRTGWTLKPVSREAESHRYFAVLDPSSDWSGIVDEDENPKPAEASSADTYELCPVCGDIQPTGFVGLDCGCGVKRIRLAGASANGAVVGRCVVCGGTNTGSGIVRSMHASAEGAASVISTALYEELHVEDGASETGQAARPKKVLVFSDSRQDAAFFAPFMKDSYGRMLRRNIVLGAAREAIDDGGNMPVLVPDLWDRVSANLRNDAPHQGMTERQVHLEAEKWVLHEFTARDRHGLEDLGLIGFRLQQPAGWHPHSELVERFGLSNEEAWDVYQVLLDSVRIRGAVAVPAGIAVDDELFLPGGLVASIRRKVPGPNLMSWEPARPPYGNRRSDYLSRLAAKVGLAGREATGLLQKLWDDDMRPSQANGLWSGYFRHQTDPQHGTSYRLEPIRWSVVAYNTCLEPQWYACDRCGRLTMRSVRGVCPEFRCHGVLRRVEISDRLSNNHYVRLYTSPTLPRRMRSEEHTAQLRPGAAAQSQTDFQEGRINILSCSTTFELGVDLGDLEVVQMNNMPPSPANYVQRAGRAGRRTDTAAMVVTYAKERPHDAFHYRYPNRMINGHISPPHFDLNNEQIVLRHMYAVALADFWRTHEGFDHHVSDFLLERDDGVCGVDLFRTYLDGSPEGIKASLRRVVPESMHGVMGVETWGWVARLFAPANAERPGQLTLARMEVSSDINALKERYEEIAARHGYVNHLAALMNTIKRRYLINFLSSRNVLPRYGFPVDVVTLDLKYNDHADADIELQRDLKLAISDYAPDSQVVARGKVWTSRYVQRMPQRAWPRYNYGSCPQCTNHVTRLDVGDGAKTSECEVCGARVEFRDSFIVPEFGFLADKGEPRPAGSYRPTKTQASRVFFSGLESEEVRPPFQMAAGAVQVSTSKQGKLAVINTARGREFLVCPSCGYSEICASRRPSTHSTAQGRKCTGKLIRAALGYEFLSDIARITFSPAPDSDESFWYSMLYATIEGACAALDVERTEIDGCLQWGGFDGHHTSLILFDSIAGGVGHVQRLGERDALVRTLQAARERMSSCECGGDSDSGSCYNCLCHYSNQFVHDILNRKTAIRFLDELGVVER